MPCLASLTKRIFSPIRRLNSFWARLLPYFLAYPLWLALNVGALYVSLRPFGGRPLFLLLLLCPAGLIWLLCGQNSLLSTALIITALRIMDSAPRRAGICIGLLIIKPHLALLFPVFLLVTRRWQVFVYAALTLGALVALSILCFGTAPWIAYWTIGMPQITAAFVSVTDMVMSLSPTLFSELRLIGAAPTTAFAFQMAETALVALCFAVCIRRADSLPYCLLVFTTASILVTCYLLAYDLVPFSFGLIYLAYRVPLTRFEARLVVACFWLPLLAFFLKAYGVPGPSLLPVLLLGCLLVGPSRRLRNQP